MTNVVNNKGLTLVEMVISLAILGMMVVTFLSIFLGSYTMTMRAEARSNTTALVAGEIDSQLAISSSPGITGNAYIQYSDGVTNSIAGKSIDASITNDSNQTVLITYFVPDIAPEAAP